jgi:hypothetical protein
MAATTLRQDGGAKSQSFVDTPKEHFADLGIDCVIDDQAAIAAKRRIISKPAQSRVEGETMGKSSKIQLREAVRNVIALENSAPTG